MKCQKSGIFVHPKKPKVSGNSETPGFRVVKNRRFLTKAQGLSLETIIVAILVLLVLIVLTLIFTGRMHIFGLGLRTCDGECSTTEYCGKDKAAIPVDNCKDMGADYKYCCVEVVKQPA